MESGKPYNTIIPYLCVGGAERAIEYYREVFGARELDRYQEAPGERVGHATLEVNGSYLFLADAFPEIGVISPTTLGGTAVTIHLMVPDLDATTEKAVTLGAKLVREPKDQPHGQRNSKIIDPFGHSWMLSSALS